MADRGLALPHGGDLDRIFDILSHPYRRRLLLLLAEADQSVDADAATARIATEQDPPDVLMTELHHAHLPKLHEAGYIDWDRDAMELRRGPQFAEIEPMVELIDEHGEGLPTDWP